MSNNPNELRRVWVDLGDLLTPKPDPMHFYQDHGVGLLRTILHANGLYTDILSTRNCQWWSEIESNVAGYDMLLMNVRSYTWPAAYRVAQLFKQRNPKGIVIVGGMHATVSIDDMTSIREFDHICQGPGEKVIVELVRNPQLHPRVIKGISAASMDDWPMMDRTLWPKPPAAFSYLNPYWPLEPGVWGPPPVATINTSRVCPWQCSFCNENSFIENMGRRSVDGVIDELNYLDRTYGPLGSVVIHDSMFFQNPQWLKEWLEKYPKKANKIWPYWAAGRADTVHAWPDLFEALVRETNWRTISIGFESGSDRILRMLNKQCTEEDNYFTIDLVNRIGDAMEREGKVPPYFWSNIILGIPGETHEDAFKTARMVQSMKRQMVSVAYYAPYPGSILGHQLIAENKSLMTKEQHDRHPTAPKVKGIDYRFYQELTAGKYAAEVARVIPPRFTPHVSGGGRQEHPFRFSPAHYFYMFALKNGKRRSSYGATPEDALEVLRMRLSAEEMAEINPNDYIKTTQKDMRQHLSVLG